MNTAHIINDTARRTYPLPNRTWNYYQQWHDSIFLHWSIPAEKIEELLPPELKLDKFEGRAWVSLVAFEVQKMRVHYLPTFPYISDYKEINVRTYVTHKGIRGTYLLSIETDKLIEVFLTKAFIGLPYIKSDIKTYTKSDVPKKDTNFLSINDDNEYFLDMSFQPNGLSMKKKSELDCWLTERHCLFTYQNNTLYRHDIHHKEWDFEEIDISIWDLDYDFKNLSLNINPDKIHFAKKTEVLLWSRKIMD
ncbi:YqjF family protein [Flavobacterium aquicola]|uniref:DUF2071 domain-containing protein n=1 Tax=Flavobacterium aquicola TaxID=1682742 RepID=A0A3E0EMP6_9FLAO|nr:DUF2071 domain-containing protein [Flavobacterium aquicola]REG99532.1 hypothetical protein C8P67_104150 [Flavobacterium aquicola]